jgi:hypothetical protein
MVYMDFLTADVFIFGNVFYACYGGQAIHIGGARYNKIENNIFVDCHPALWIDSRSAGIWGEALEQYDYQEPPWSVRYPRFVYMKEEAPFGGPPLHTSVAHNLCWGGWDDHVDAPAREVAYWVQNKVVDVDPGFIDADSMDFRLSDEAQSRLHQEIRFVPIPFEQIGCINNEERASWPVPQRIKPDRPHKYIVQVPRVSEPVTVDGQADEWAGVPRCPIEHNLSGGFLRLAWHDEALYGFVQAKDGTPNANLDLPWMGDGVMVYVEWDMARRKQLSGNCLAFTLTPRFDALPGEGLIGEWSWDDPAGAYAALRSLGQDPRGIRCQAAPRDEGYALEFAIPAAALERELLTPGTEMGFLASLLDGGAEVETFYAPEFPTTGAPFTWGRIQLVRGHNE